MNIEISKSLEFKREIIKDCAENESLMNEVAALAAVRANEIAKEAFENANDLSKFIPGNKVIFKISVQLLSAEDNDEE